MEAPDPEQKARETLLLRRWRDKFSVLCERLGVELGERARRQKFEGLELGLNAKRFHDPVEYLELLASIRHAVVSPAPEEPTRRTSA